MNKKCLIAALILLLVFAFSSKLVHAAWPVLNEKNMQQFMHTFPGMYRQYKALGQLAATASGSRTTAQPPDVPDNNTIPPRPPSLPIRGQNPMVHQDGARIVDGQARPLKLRGVLLEGWLMWNGTLWGAGLTSETKITQKLRELVGQQEAERFRNQIYQTFIREDDIEMIAKMGFNVIRLPFNHRILEDDARPFQYKNSGWQILNRLLAWCEKYGVYVVLDMH